MPLSLPVSASGGRCQCPTRRVRRPPALFNDCQCPTTRVAARPPAARGQWHWQTPRYLPRPGPRPSVCHCSSTTTSCPVAMPRRSLRRRQTVTPGGCQWQAASHKLAGCGGAPRPRRHAAAARARLVGRVATLQPLAPRPAPLGPRRRRRGCRRLPALASLSGSGHRGLAGGDSARELSRQWPAAASVGAAAGACHHDGAAAACRRASVRVAQLELHPGNCTRPQLHRAPRRNTLRNRSQRPRR